MSAISSQITSLTIVYSTFMQSQIKEKNQSSMSLAFVRGIHLWSVISRTKGQLRGFLSIWWRHHACLFDYGSASIYMYFFKREILFRRYYSICSLKLILLTLAKAQISKVQQGSSYNWHFQYTDTVCDVFRTRSLAWVVDLQGNVT